MEERVIRFTAVFFSVLTVVICVSLYFFPDMHAKAVERAEEKQAQEEYAAKQQQEMTELMLGKTEQAVENSTPQNTAQLQLKLPEGVKGEEILTQDNYVTQTVTVEIPEVGATYFDSYPMTGKSNHIDNLSYMVENGEGMIEIALDQVYELKTSYDADYFYLDFVDPHEIYDKIVVIDAGHGGRAPGATIKGVNEKDIDLAIVLKLKEIFDASGENIGVYYTRTDDSNPTFDQRVQLANKSQADLFISIHNNSTPSGRMSGIKGTQVMFSESDTNELGSRHLAEICMEEVTAMTGSVDKGFVEGDSIYIIRTSEVPVALIEVGFMTNQEELDNLNSEEYQEKTAQGVYNAILRALSEGY